ncbi:MAG TPA: tetratricopeptide repeat protein, partial [Flavisolibacter sp.]|nr:tetratricopeptide repeat protein [Flavisolibacter sp.]
KGLYYENMGNTAEALKQMDAAISHDYYFLDAHMEKGQILYNEKRFADALKAFQLANTISPSFAEGFYWLGKTKEAMGNKAEAKLDYQRAHGLDKTMLDAKTAADKIQ